MIYGPVHYRVDRWYDGEWLIVARSPERDQGKKLYERMARHQKCRFVEVRETVIVENNI